MVMKHKSKTISVPSSTFNKQKVAISSALGELKTLKNSLTDLIPMQAYDTVQLSNLETLFVNNRYTPLTINRVLLAYMYCEHGIIQSAIEQPILDGLRGGLNIESPELDGDDIKSFQDYLEDKSIMATIVETEIWKDVFGGSGLIINIEVDPARPYDQKTPPKGELEFYAADRWELASDRRGTDQYNFYGTFLDRSRVIERIGKKPPAFIRPQLMGWGMSKIERMVRELNAFLKHNDLIFELLDEAKVDVYSIDQFNSSLMTASGTEKIRKRIQVGNQLKNFNNAVVLDMKDKFEQKQLSFGGLAEILQQLRIGIACVMRMPVTKLFGLSAAGFNSGEDDLENYNAMIESEIRTPMRPMLHKVLNLCMMNHFGFLPKYTFDFKPLRVMSDEQEETVKTSKQNRVMMLYDKALLTSEEVGQCCRAYNLLPVQTLLEEGKLEEHPVPVMPQFSEEGDGDEGEENG